MSLKTEDLSITLEVVSDVFNDHTPSSLRITRKDVDVNRKPYSMKTFNGI